MLSAALSINLKKKVKFVNFVNMKKILLVSLLLVVILLLVGCSSERKGGETEAEAIAIARCIKDKDTKFYGAFWCPKCADQKKLFGKSVEADIPYLECDPRGENPVTDLCLEINIEKYPTWIFADGSRDVGVISLQDLAAKSGCDVDELAKY